MAIVFQCTNLALFLVLTLSMAQARLLGKGRHGPGYGNGGRYRKDPPDKDCIFCDRPTPYSIVNPNDLWVNQTYHAQVWYLSLEDAYDLWNKGYFDYVLDVRGLNPFKEPSLPNWEEGHVPGSYPTDFRCLFNGFGDCDDDLTLQYFLDSPVCLDAKILVHCWTGKMANMAVTPLVKLGFTNLYTMGPEGTAGYLHWAEADYDTAMSTYQKNELVPSCAKKCQ